MLFRFNQVFWTESPAYGRCLWFMVEAFGIRIYLMQFKITIDKIANDSSEKSNLLRKYACQQMMTVSETMNVELKMPNRNKNHDDIE